jgi:ketosteroid isomerase-like protein
VFDWLFEGRLTVYVALAVVALLLAARWWQTRRGAWLVGAACALALIGVYYVLDRARETDREQIERKLQEMAAAVRPRDVRRICAHISESFQLQGVGKATFCEFADRMMRTRQVTDLVVFDVGFPPGFKSSFEDRSGGAPRRTEQARVQLRAKPRGDAQGTNITYPVEATFVRDPDGQWRLQTFQVFSPGGLNETLPIPQLSP